MSPAPLFSVFVSSPFFFFFLGEGVKVLWWFCLFRTIGRSHSIAFVTTHSWHWVWATAIGTLIETLYVFIASSTSLSQRPSHWRLVMFFQCVRLCFWDPVWTESVSVWMLCVCVCTFYGPSMHVCLPIGRKIILSQLFLLDGNEIKGKRPQKSLVTFQKRSQPSQTVLRLAKIKKKKSGKIKIKWKYTSNAKN